MTTEEINEQIKVLNDKLNVIIHMCHKYTALEMPEEAARYDVLVAKVKWKRDQLHLLLDNKFLEGLEAEFLGDE